MVYSACHVAVLKVVASRAFCPDVRGRTSMLMGSFHNMFTIGHGSSSISVQKVGSMQHYKTKRQSCSINAPIYGRIVATSSFALSPATARDCPKTTPTKLSNMVVHYSSTGKDPFLEEQKTRIMITLLLFPTFEWMSHYNTRK